MRAAGPEAAGLSANSAIGTQLRDPINSGLTRRRLTVKMDAVAESRRNPVGRHQIPPECVENERADAGRAEPIK